MDSAEKSQKYPIGHRVTAQIVQIGHSGVHVRINDEADGYVKRVETLLSLKPVDLRKKFSIGQKVPAVILGYHEKYDSFDVSFRQAEDDPWETYIAGIVENAVVEGEVVLITESKAIIEIIPGVTGILAKNELWLKAARVDEVLMVRDRVRAQVLAVFAEEKMLLLSVRRLFEGEKDFDGEQMMYPIEESLTDALKIYRWEQDKETQQKLVLSNRFKEMVQKIVVLQAEDSITDAMVMMLNSLGLYTEPVHWQQGELYAILQKSNCDLCILSCALLPMLTTELEALLETYFLIIYGSNEQFAQVEYLLQEYALFDRFLSVPHSAEEFMEKLNSCVQVHSNQAAEISPSGQFEFAFEEYPAKSYKNIHQLLEEIKKMANASFVAIFQLNLNTLDAEVFAVVGANFELSPFDKGHLQFSPISDVIIDGDTVQLSHKGLYLKYMKSFGSFDSLAGIRIDFTDEFGYGLFLFGEHADQFKHLPKTFLGFCELAVRAHIEQNKFLENRCSEQKFILTGKLTASLVHEIKNQMQAMQYWLEVLHTDSIHLNSGELRGTDKVFLARFDQSVNGALAIEKRTRNVEEMFLSLLRKESIKIIHVDRYINTFVDTVRPIAKKYHIEVIVHAENNIRALLDTSMLNQILVNLYLNSIDFIPLVRKQTGRIEISVHKTKDAQRPLIIEFKDNGPGINEKLREKVFELLYTSKTNGSGLGLGISRKMAEKMGGFLYIYETVRLSGTTFRLELPLTQEGQYEK